LALWPGPPGSPARGGRTGLRYPAPDAGEGTGLLIALPALRECKHPYWPVTRIGAGSWVSWHAVTCCWWLLRQPQGQMQQSRLPDGPAAPVITLFHPGESSCGIWLEVGHLPEAGACRLAGDGSPWSRSSCRPGRRTPADR